jgi:hypothetical protein
MRLVKTPAATVSNMKNNDGLGLDSKEHPVLMRLMSVKKLAHLEEKLGILRGNHTALRHLGERIYGFRQFPKPSQASIARLLRQKPLQNQF